jgi:FMN phosphatase YigB (HAD superfamily)
MLTRMLYFDWSGTLARSGTKQTFLEGNLAEKEATLFPDTRRTLAALSRAGYTLGIVSNTGKSPDAFRRALRATGLANYFKGAILVTDGTEVCKKPCIDAFHTVLAADGVAPFTAAMIGNDFEKDVRGAEAAGLRAFFVDREGTGPHHPNKIRSLWELVEMFGIQRHRTQRRTRRRMRGAAHRKHTR